MRLVAGERVGERAVGGATLALRGRAIDRGADQGMPEIETGAVDRNQSGALRLVEGRGVDTEARAGPMDDRGFLGVVRGREQEQAPRLGRQAARALMEDGLELARHRQRGV